MKIIVCVKQVEIVAARSAFDAVPERVAPENLIHALNPCDEAAVEEALRIRDARGGEVTVVSVGPPRAADALRRCLAMGAGDAVHVLDRTSRAVDPWAVSRALATAVRAIGCDLILCGRIAADDGMGVVGTFLAELLELPLVTGVVTIELRTSDRKAVLQRAVGRGNRESVECLLPAVLTIDKAANKPRYPTLAGRRRAERQDIRTLDPDRADVPTPGLDELPVLEIVRLAPPKIRPRKILAPDEEHSAAGRLQWIFSGGRQRKAGDRVTGDPVRLAEGIVAFLRERRFLSEPPRRRTLPPVG